MDMKDTFTPGIFIHCSQLVNYPVKDLLARYDTLRRACKDLFNFRWDNNVLYVSDVYGNAYKLSLTMNYHCEKGRHIEHNEVIVTVWNMTSNQVFCKCFTLDTQGRLTHSAVNEIDDTMQEYTRGTFHCAFCGQAAKRFGNGTGHCPCGEVCAECNAKLEVKARISRQYHDMSN